MDKRTEIGNVVGQGDKKFGFRQNVKKLVELAASTVVSSLCGVESRTNNDIRMGNFTSQSPACPLVSVKLSHPQLWSVYRQRRAERRTALQKSLAVTTANRRQENGSHNQGTSGGESKIKEHDWKRSGNNGKNLSN